MAKNDFTNELLVAALAKRVIRTSKQQGETGLRGEVGPQGNPGMQGEPGPQGAQGDVGLQGEQGVPGKDGDQGPEGQQGQKGEQGERGEQGPMPDHQWQTTRLRLQKPDGEWGVYVDLAGKDGKQGMQGYGGGAGYGFDPSSLPAATFDTPTEFIVKQGDAWVRASYAQMVQWFYPTISTVNGDSVTVNGEFVTVNGV